MLGFYPFAKQASPMYTQTHITQPQAVEVEIDAATGEPEEEEEKEATKTGNIRRAS